MDNVSLSEHFSQYFDIFLADTPELKQEVFKIRYQVYCRELGYEPIENFPDFMEQDSYDDRSIHCILQHKSTGIYAGCVRLVLSSPSKKKESFPFENICPKHSLDFNHIPRKNIAEISRLAVISQFRKRLGEENTSTGLIVFNEQKQEFLKQQRRRSSVIALSLYLAATSITAHLNLTYGVTLMEPRLARHLRMSGLVAHQIGDVIEFHGKRGPFILQTKEALNSLSKNMEVYRLFKKIQASVGDNLSDSFCSA